MFAELERLRYSFGCVEHTITLRYERHINSTHSPFSTVR